MDGHLRRAGLNTGARWRSLPREYGKWGSAHKRFKRWADKGVWQMVFNTLVEDADMEWVMIDATIIRAHQHAAGAKKGSKTTHEDGLVAAFLPRYIWPWMPMVCQSELVLQMVPLQIENRQMLLWKTSTQAIF